MANLSGVADDPPTPPRHRICNLVPSKKTERNWSHDVAIAAGALVEPAALPASVDLREAWWTIGDQGLTGSCVGWATADSVVRYHMVKAGQLANSELLSVRFVWMASKETDDFIARPETFIEEAGTSLKAALDVCRNYGVVSNNLLPFNIYTLMYQGKEDDFYAMAAQRKITSYFDLKKDLNAWKVWLATKGPILTGLNVDMTWDDGLNNHGNLDVYRPSPDRGGHAIAIVGYLADGRFIVRNSWGRTTWGDNGFGYTTAAYINAAFFDEAYGVNL
jgi:C1A family cysteine protease